MHDFTRALLGEVRSVEKRIAAFMEPTACLDAPASAQSSAHISVHAPAPASFQALIARNGARSGVDPALIEAVISAESSFDAHAKSSVGAMGLMQLMPQTAAALGVSDPYDPAQNISGGSRYLRSLLDRFGDVRLAVAAYNAGPGAIERYAGIPPYEQTRTYVSHVMEKYEALRHSEELSQKEK